MEISRKYKGFVSRILTRDKDKEEGIRLQFEDIDVFLEPREFYLVCYAIARHRPTNRTINKLLFDFIRGFHGITIPHFIVDWSRSNNMLLNFSGCEETSYKKSLATSGPNNPNYNGTIYAVNIETDDIIPMNSVTDIESYGFESSCVYLCVNGKQFTHKGYVFIRESDIKRPRKFQRERLGFK